MSLNNPLLIEYKEGDGITLHYVRLLTDGSEVPHGIEKVSHHVARGPLRGSCVKELLVASGS